MPDKKTVRRAAKDRRQGKAASTQAGEFVREEIDHIREGKHGARSAKQAIAIGLSKARQAGVDVPEKGKRSGRGASTTSTRKKTTSRRSSSESRSKRSKVATKALKREPRRAASHTSLSRQASKASRKRTASQRSASARRGARTRRAAARAR